MKREILVLTEPQILALADAEIAFRKNKRVQVQELCARFGKTPWLLTLFKRSSKQVMVVTSYWLGALSSFEKDIARFSSFEDMVLVDTRDDNYSVTLQENINNGKKVVVLVSLCGNGVDKHETKKSELLPLANIDKLVGVDEADFGAWQPQQVRLLEYLIRDNDQVILMSGTGGERAATNIKVDHFNSITYFDMLVSKGSHPVSMKSIPNVEFYRVSLPKAANQSWSKVIKNLSSAHNVINTVFGTLFNGMFDTMFGKRPTGIMIWLPERERKETVDEFVEILKPIANKWRVIGIHGDIINGREAEAYVNEQHAEAIKQGLYGIVVVSIKLGARSFSIPSIDTVVLAYDYGSCAQTTQKMSRCLTRLYNTEKVGHVVNVNLDPSRDDNFNTPIFETARRLSQRTGLELMEAVDKVIRTLSIYAVDEHSNKVRVSPNTASDVVMGIYVKSLRESTKLLRSVL